MWGISQRIQAPGLGHFVERCAMAASGVTFRLFLDSRRKDLRRIASQTCGECTIDDVCSETWLVANEISRKRGFSVDFLNTDDQ